MLEFTHGETTAPNAEPFDVPYPLSARQLQNDVRIVVRFEHRRIPAQTERKKKNSEEPRVPLLCP